MHHAGDVVANLMHRAVDGVAGGIDLVGGVHHLVAGQVDLDQARGGDFMEHQPVRIDQEMLGFGNLRRDMGEDEVLDFEYEEEEDDDDLDYEYEEEDWEEK